jgi:hypothetical protein
MATPYFVPLSAESPDLMIDLNDFDTKGMHAIGTSYIVAKKTGIYLVVGTAEWSGTGAGPGVREIRIYRNGLLVCANKKDFADAPIHQAVGLISMNAKDVVTIRVYSNSFLMLSVLGGSRDKTSLAISLVP